MLVTGGASFIGSHLVDRLLRDGAAVDVADDLSSGSFDNLNYLLRSQARADVWKFGELTFYKGDLKDRSFVQRVVEDAEVVFHLAALHGGRGYISSHPAECCSNMALDQLVFEEALKAGVERICFASSACVYPSYLQDQSGSDYLLKEEDCDPFTRDKAFADLEYGWAKLMGEMSLSAYSRQYGIKTSSVRIYTCYGPRENETHAIMALIAKVFLRMDPFVIWGNGEQDRNFTYVDDVVDALMLASEKIEDGSPVNAGRDDRITINKAAELLFKIANWRPARISHDLSKPTGVASRAADLTRARAVLDWEPMVSYEEGFQRSVDWYFSHREPDKVRDSLDSLLMERTALHTS